MVLSPATPTAEETGTAGGTGGSCTTPSPNNIPAYSGSGNPHKISFICSYSASTGAVGGFASFSTRATGTMNGVAVSSAQEVSNSVQIGGTVSVLNQGPFSADSFFFKDTYCNFTAGHFWVTPCDPRPGGHLTDLTLPNANPQNASSNYYVAYYLHVTNNFNATLDVLQYSYFQTDPSLGGESDFYVVGAASSYNSPACQSTMTPSCYFPNYNSSIPTLTAYGGDVLTCQNTPSACIRIKPGGSIYLTFAACKAGSTSWNWGDSQYGRAFDNPVDCSPQTPPNYQTPEATYLSIVLSFLPENGSLRGQVFDQQIPFQGETIFGGANQPPSCSTGNYCGTVVYTQYTGSVGYFNFVYNPTAGTFKIPTPPHVINNNLPYGTDGVVYNPQDHKLILGTNQPNDQSVHFNEVDPNTGAVTTYNNNANTYSLNVMVSSDGTRVYMDGDGCNGGGYGGCAPQSSNLAWAPLTPTVGNAVTTLTLSGNDKVLNTVVFVSPTLAYYVAELSPQFKGQTGHVGTLNPQTGVTTCFKTGSSCTVYDGVHGMVYDPFTNDLIVFGSNIVTQIDPTTGAVVAKETIRALDPSSGNFDQGAVDGFGHLFISWAGSPGYIYFEDYSSGTIRNGTFNDAITNGASCSVIGGACILNGGQNSLGNPDAFDSIDDLAPIVGPGSQG